MVIIKMKQKHKNPNYSMRKCDCKKQKYLTDKRYKDTLEERIEAIMSSDLAILRQNSKTSKDNRH